MNLKFDVASKTDQGRTRSYNQDTVNHWFKNSTDGPSKALLLVADGVGGQEAGDVASRLAVETMTAVLLPLLQSAESFDEGWNEKINKAVEKSNLAIIDYANESGIEPKKMGTTLECAIVINNQVLFAHVGDSRAYLLKPRGLTQLTEDHSAVMQLVKAGIISAEDIYTHPHKNILIRGLGGEKDVEVDIIEDELGVGQRIMLCTDGLWGMVKDDVLENILLQTKSAEDLVDQFIDAANESGGEDNIGVLVCDIMRG